MAVSWSSIYPERQDPQAIKAEIAAARKLEAQGFIVLHRDHLYNEPLTAIAVRSNLDAVCWTNVAELKRCEPP